jgi:hypothetical protein
MESSAQAIYDFGLLFVVTVHIYSSVSRAKFMTLYHCTMDLAHVVQRLEGELSALNEQVRIMKTRSDDNDAVAAQLAALQGDMVSRTRNIQDYENYLRQHGNLSR